MCKAKFKYLTGGAKLYMTNLLLPRYELKMINSSEGGNLFFEDKARRERAENCRI